MILKRLFMLPVLLVACMEQRGDFNVRLENNTDSSFLLCNGERIETCLEIIKNDTTSYDFYKDKKESWATSIKEANIRICNRKIYIPDLVKIAVPTLRDGYNYVVVIDKEVEKKLCTNEETLSLLFSK